MQPVGPSTPPPTHGAITRHSLLTSLYILIQPLLFIYPTKLSYVSKLLTSWSGRMSKSTRLPFWEIGESERRRFESGPHVFLILVEPNQ